MRRLGKSDVLLFLAFVLSLGANLKTRSKLNHQIQEDASLREENQYLEFFKQALIKVLNDKKPSSLSHTADLGVGMATEGPLIGDSGSVVLYRLAADCPVCPLNYGLLNELSGLGVPVVGIAVSATKAEVERHRAEWDVEFPILVNPQGSAVEMVPRYGTPTIVVISKGEVVFLEFGALAPVAERTLRAITGMWARDSAQPSS